MAPKGLQVASSRICRFVHEVYVPKRIGATLRYPAPSALADGGMRDWPCTSGEDPVRAEHQ